MMLPAADAPSFTLEAALRARAALVLGPPTTRPVAGSTSASTRDRFTDWEVGNCDTPGGFSSFKVSGFIPIVDRALLTAGSAFMSARRAEFVRIPGLVLAVAISARARSSSTSEHLPVRIL